MGSLGTFAQAYTNYGAARENESNMQQAAVYARQRGRWQKRRVREEGSAISGQQRVGISAGGETLSNQGATRILGSTARATELQAIKIDNDAKAEAWGLLEQGKLERKAAKKSLWATGLGFAAESTQWGISLAKDG